MPDTKEQRNIACRAVVIWIDWYAYHVARFRGLQSAFGTSGEVTGIELVGGIGVHAGFKFRAERKESTHVETLLPRSDWSTASKLLLARLLWSRLNALKPDKVLVPGYYTIPALVAALWAKVHRKQSVLMTESTAGDHERTTAKELFKGAAIRFLFSSAVTGGQAHVRYLKALGFPTDRIFGFYDVVDNEGLRQETAALRLNNTAADFALPARYFLYVGRLAAEKNVVQLLSAWVKYRQNGGVWSLVLVGDGPEARALKDLAASSRFSQQIVFTGHQSAKQIASYLSFATCFVLPSLREPWGLVVNEAMAASLPVIVSNHCGCAEDLVQEGQNGFRFDPEFPEHLVDCLHKAEALTDSRRHEMGRRSANLIAPFSPDHFGLEIASISESIRRVSRGVHSPRSSEPNA